MLAHISWKVQKQDHMSVSKTTCYSTASCTIRRVDHAIRGAAGIVPLVTADAGLTVIASV